MLVYACKPGIPKDIIQPEEMEKVLYDIHVVDGYSSTFTMATTDSIKKSISPYYKGVYQKYGIDSALYNRSLAYYYKHPQVMKLMYDHITDRLLKAKDKAVKVEEKAAELAKPAAGATPQESPLPTETKQAQEAVPVPNPAH